MSKMVSNEEEHFLRIVYLNFRVATGAITRFFDKLHPNLSADLNIPQNKAILLQLYNPPSGKKRVLFQGQWNILYPSPAAGSPVVTSADLDLTLIVCLLRNLPPVLTAPVNGFDNLPPSHDISDGANIARLKYYKNFLVSHSKDGTLSNPDFVRIWIELEQAIMGLDNSQVTIASLKDAETKMLDSSMAQLLSIQIQLDKKVSSLQDDFEQISIHIEKDVQEKKELKMIADDLDERKIIKRDNLETDVKECTENVDRVYERQNTIEEQMNERMKIIEEKLDKLHNLQQLIVSQINRIETIVNDSEKEKETLVKGVQSLCSQNEDNIIMITNNKKRIYALETQSEILQEVQKDVVNLKMKSECIEAEIKRQDVNHIPKNIRAQHRLEIEEWEQDQLTFVEIRASHHILELLSLNNCIVVTGSLGCGKSSNIHHTAFHLRDSFGYEIIPVLAGPTDIINYYDENKNQVFVVDDICGKETINTHSLQIWRDYADRMKKIFTVQEKEVAKTNNGTVLEVSSPKLLISCRLHIFKEPQFQRIEFITQYECNLLSSELCLVQQERMLMLHKYLPDDVMSNVSLNHVLDNHTFFPLLCKLSKTKHRKKSTNFLKLL